MRHSARTTAIGLGLGTMVLAASLPLVAQPPASKSDGARVAPPPAKTVDPARRVPANFGQLALSPEQRESIYQIQAKHFARIDELEQEIKDIRRKSDQECETVLTDIQKQLLEQLRRNAAERNKRVAPKATKGQPAPSK